MKSIITCIIATLFACIALEARVEDSAKFTPEQRKQLVEMNKRVFGGFVTKPDPGNGHIAVVNQQSKVTEKELLQAIRYVMRVSSLPIELKSAPDPKAAISVYIKDDPAQRSTLIVSPGEFWSHVNVAALAADKPSTGVLALRARKELARGLAYACGGGGSQYEGTLAGPIKSLHQLDTFSDEGLPPDAFLRMSVFAKAMGIRQLHRVSYAAACEEGWAPAPTNDYQKAIWDKVHKLPTEPIKIEPEAKKVKE